MRPVFGNYANAVAACEKRPNCLLLAIFLLIKVKRGHRADTVTVNSSIPTAVGVLNSVKHAIIEL